MSTFFQLIFSGLEMGSIFALATLGIIIIFRTTYFFPCVPTSYWKESHSVFKFHCQFTSASAVNMYRSFI